MNGLAAWISSAGPRSGVGRVGAALTAPFRAEPDFRKLYFDGAARRLEETGPEGARILDVGRLPVPKSVFALSAAGRLPRYRAAFVDSQNLAFLRPDFPACLFVHDLFYWTHPRSLVERVQGHLLYRGLDRYEAILVNSEYTRAELLSRSAVDPARVTVVPLGYDAATFRPGEVDRSKLLASAGLRGDARAVLHLSSGEPRKNLPRLLHAFARVARGRPDVFFVKAGGNLHPEARNDARRLAADLGVADRVRILGPLDDAALADWYRACDVFALPSLAEGFGLPALEAQACGARVIASSGTALAEVAGPLCRTVDPRDEEAIAAALSAALDEAPPSARERDAQAAWVARFSWEPGRDFLARFLGFRR